MTEITGDQLLPQLLLSHTLHAPFLPSNGVLMVERAIVTYYRNYKCTPKTTQRSPHYSPHLFNHLNLQPKFSYNISVAKAVGVGRAKRKAKLITVYPTPKKWPRKKSMVEKNSRTLTKPIV